MDITVVIPSYNEAHYLPRVIKNVDNFFRNQHIAGEIVVVNDGSTDTSGELLAHLKKDVACLRVLTLPQNQGKGAACRAGFAASNGEWCIFMDADESTHVETWCAFQPYAANYDVLIGSRAIAGARIKKSQHWAKVWAGRLGNKWIKLITGLPFNDTQCGFKAFRRHTRALLSYARIDGWAFDIEWLVISRARRFRIKELPVCWENDTSSLVQPMDYVRVLMEVIRIRARYIF